MEGMDTMKVNAVVILLLGVVLLVLDTIRIIQIWR